MMQPRDKWIPWYFVLFFAVVFAANAVFIYLAVSTNTGVVTEKAYEKGIQYDKAIAAVEKQRVLGWQADILFENPQLSFNLRDKANKLISGAMVTAYFIRPTQDGYDFSVPLAPSKSGVYESNISFPLKGVWDLRIEAIWNAQHYQQGQRIFAK